MILILLGIHLETEVLGNMVTVEIFEGPQDCFAKGLHHLTFPVARHEASSFSTPSSTLVDVCLFASSLLVDVK